MQSPRAFRTIRNRTRSALFVMSLASELWLEARRPLRTPTQPKLRRVIRNLAIASVAGALFRVLVSRVALPTSQRVAERRFGLFQWLALPRAIELPLAIVALDYLEYLWHRANHEVPLLWRFHNAHHVDLDLDVSTATRFHFGELFFSCFVQALKVAALGVDPFTFTAYFTVLVAFTQFHHGNVRLPIGLERALNHVIVTPRMHGIHHSIVRSETDSNWGIIFSFWDRAHRTLKLDVPQSEVTIGVPAYRDPKEQTFSKVLLMPFESQREWRLPDGGFPVRQSGEAA